MHYWLFNEPFPHDRCTVCNGFHYAIIKWEYFSLILFSTSLNITWMEPITCFHLSHIHVTTEVVQIWCLNTWPDLNMIIIYLRDANKYFLCCRPFVRHLKKSFCWRQIERSSLSTLWDCWTNYVIINVPHIFLNHAHDISNLMVEDLEHWSMWL